MSASKIVLDGGLQTLKMAVQQSNPTFGEGSGAGDDGLHLDGSLVDFGGNSKPHKFPVDLVKGSGGEDGIGLGDGCDVHGLAASCLHEELVIEFLHKEADFVN